MRNKLRRQDAVVFPVKAHGNKHMASVFFFFFPLSNLDSEISGDEKAIPFQGRVTMTFTLLSLMHMGSTFISIIDNNYRSWKDLVSAVPHNPLPKY